MTAISPTSLIVRHTFETAHRLPTPGAKCINLHGHSWKVEASVTSVSTEGARPVVLAIEVARLQGQVRAWIDQTLDHATMLGEEDPLVPKLLEHDVRLFRFGHDLPAQDLPWPTVQATAVLLSRVIGHLAAEIDPTLVVTRVRVDETHAQSAEWTATPLYPFKPAVIS